MTHLQELAFFELTFRILIELAFLLAFKTLINWYIDWHTATLVKFRILVIMANKNSVQENLYQLL